jgi:hypothetical protein
VEKQEDEFMLSNKSFSTVVLALTVIFLSSYYTFALNYSGSQLGL